MVSVRVLPLVAVLLLTGCAAAPQPTVTVTVTATPTMTPVTIPSSVPTCFSLVGKPENQAIVNGLPYCITGTSVHTDQTGYITTNCDPVNNSSTVIYGWSTSDPTAPDQNTYAAKVGGVVVIVPNAADSKRVFGGVLTVDYLVAVGCP